MSRACKGACAILAEGFAKRFQIKHWQKYLTDSVGECDEMIDHLIVFQDVYFEYLNKHLKNHGNASSEVLKFLEEI